MHLQSENFFDEPNDENNYRRVYLHFRKLSSSRFGDRRRQGQFRTKEARITAACIVAKLSKPVAVCVEKPLDMLVEVRPHL